MLKTAMIVLILLWFLGLVTGHTLGGFLHIILVLGLLLWMITLVRGGNVF